MSTIQLATRHNGLTYLSYVYTLVYCYFGTFQKIIIVFGQYKRQLVPWKLFPDHDIMNTKKLFVFKIIIRDNSVYRGRTPVADPYKSFLCPSSPPHRTQFFRFYICFHQKAHAMCGVPHPTQWEIMDPPLNSFCENSITSTAFDIFPNWLNSLLTAKLQIIGHALLSTNSNTLQTYLPRWSCGVVLAP